MNSVRILPFLDTAMILAHPKIMMGFSDTTTVLAYLNQLGLVTFYGPSVMAGLAQTRSLPPAFTEHLRALLFDAPPSYRYTAYESWSEGYVDWSDPLRGGQPKPAQPSAGWQWLQGSGTVRGQLWGGCIEVLEFMKATAFWPSPDFWRGRILFLETSEDQPTPTQVKYMLRNYGMQGIFDEISAILVGRPRGYTAAQRAELRSVLTSVVGAEFAQPTLPIVADVDFGHTDPQLILPLGTLAELDCDGRTLTLVESPTQAR